MGRPDSISHIVNDMKPPRFTTKQAADAIGRSTYTVQRWRRDGTFVPSDGMWFGDVFVYLYTKADLRKMSKVAATQRPGRKATVDTAHTTKATRKGVKKNAATARTKT